MTTNRRILAVLVLAVLAPGCGGGGGSGSGGTGPVGSIWFDLGEESSTTAQGRLTGTLSNFADPPGTQVTWSNATTGGAGTGYSDLVEVTYEFLGYVWTETVHKFFVEVDLVPGQNAVTVTASDNQQHVATGTITVVYTPPLPSVHIVSPWSGPAWSTMDSPLALSGTASSPLGISSVAWSNDLTGVTGTATGTTSWAALVPLGLGSNPIHMTATDVLGATATATLAVTYPAANPPPTVTVTSPAGASSGSFATSSESVLLEGQATSAFGIERVDCVTVETGMAGSQGGPGMLDWSYFTWLQVGTNTIVITATDVAGQTATTTVVVTRGP